MSRIEQAASRTTEADPELATRHERLREAVTLSLHQLDALLAGQRA